MNARQTHFTTKVEQDSEFCLDRSLGSSNGLSNIVKSRSFPPSRMITAENIKKASSDQSAAYDWCKHAGQKREKYHLKFRQLIKHNIFQCTKLAHEEQLCIISDTSVEEEINNHNVMTNDVSAK